jgi:hypothetical protein
VFSESPQEDPVTIALNELVLNAVASKFGSVLGHIVVRGTTPAPWLASSERASEPGKLGVAVQSSSSTGAAGFGAPLRTKSIATLK